MSGRGQGGGFSKNPRRSPAGQSSVEYVVALAVVAALLLADAQTGSGKSVLVEFLDAIKTAWTNLLYALSLPV